MSNERPKPGTKEFEEWVRQETQSVVDDMFKHGPADFDESGVIFGGEKSLNSSDAEAFPDEIEEYRPEERKPPLVHNSDKSRKKT
ncbi:hypothetical protein HCH_03810 [Hahella chejuensis KCTC 2396]|uniref:Uncharacterized protein n=1 Tax=Hahella chejuensis (strain KCTC 2396) TaxID=349521 RepID=Q2SFN3_HAHCH|nr:hypothetical protein [Hahella chejuensis]ABC30541.1 hypothetical protein HCH_03810 [Hahella chejuensis KCTC 2396]